jgi:hypothetical protein
MEATQRPAWERRSTTGALLTVGGGALVAASSFLPWLTGGGPSLTGWELYDLRNEAGENPFVIDEMFEPTFDPFVTGAVTLGFGVALAVLGVALLSVDKRPPPAKYRVPPGLYWVGAFLSVFAGLAVFFNLYSVFTPPEFVTVEAGVGLFVAAAGVVLALVGVSRAAVESPADRRARRAGVPMAVPQPATMGAAPEPGWHPDPQGRHQYRWWDGHGWTTHVSDTGVPSEDPV